MFYSLACIQTPFQFIISRFPKKKTQVNNSVLDVATAALHQLFDFHHSFSEIESAKSSTKTDIYLKEEKKKEYVQFWFELSPEKCTRWIDKVEWYVIYTWEKLQHNLFFFSDSDHLSECKCDMARTKYTPIQALYTASVGRKKNRIMNIME